MSLKSLTLKWRIPLALLFIIGGILGGFVPLVPDVILIIIGAALIIDPKWADTQIRRLKKKLKNRP